MRKSTRSVVAMRLRHHPVSTTLGCALVLAALCAPRANAQIAVSLQAAMTLVGGDDFAEDLNDMNRGDSRFGSVRALVLGRGKINDTTSLYLEVPIDLAATSSTWLTYMRPFIRMERLGSADWLNLQVGKLPTLVGAYGERSNSTGNALIGVPLLFYYHTAVRSRLAVEGPDYFFEDGVRGGGFRGIFGGPVTSFQGAPLLYDACWEVGSEVYGAHRGVEYSLAGTMGSVSRPAISENYNDGYGVTGRLGYIFRDGALFGLRLGVSAAAAPYLDAGIVDDPDFPSGADVEDYLNTYVGGDLTYARGPWQFFGEVGRVGYEVPNVDPRLTATSYYAEIVRDFGPQWSLGVRQEGVFFSDLTASDGRTGTWDHDLGRIEAMINFRFRHGTMLRAGYQKTWFPDAGTLDAELFALQLQVWTR